MMGVPLYLSIPVIFALISNGSQIAREYVGFDVAIKVYPEPALSIESPLNSAMPLVTVSVVVPERVPLPGLSCMERVTSVELSEITVFPNSSWHAILRPS